MYITQYVHVIIQSELDWSTDLLSAPVKHPIKAAWSCVDIVTTHVTCFHIHTIYW